MKRVAIVQSSYIPWKGYFSLIQLVDEFILYDDVQYTHRDWRNRNRIKTPTGTEWLTIPVTVRGRRLQRVRDACVCEPVWARKHWRSICHSYAKALHFAALAPTFERLYAQCEMETSLSRINHAFLQAICEQLAIATPISRSMDYVLDGGRTERLVNLCRQAGASEYLTGPAARSYLDESLFERAGIRVLWMDYDGYPEHRQLYTPPFEHTVTILDLLLNEGPRGAADYMAAYRSVAAARLAEARTAAAQPQGHAYA
jgi:hypothetical protein